MNPIIPNLTPELIIHTDGDEVAKSSSYEISTYRKLVEHIARLSYLHNNQLLFFRGQGRDFQNKVGASTFYPTIYRGDYVTQDELHYRFRVLDECCRQLKLLFERNQLEGKKEVLRKTYVQWSILQHYEVCDTPLIDFTHSLRVACSFAQSRALDSASFVYVFGLPYLSNRISINSEEDLVNVRLLSICPPQALRPYFQDGYLCGTTDITWEFPDKTELDFNRRLIAKFQISKFAKFWGEGFQRIPDSVLYPRGDKVKALADQILPMASEEILSDELGSFIRDWTRLENILTIRAQDYDPKVQSALSAVKVLQKYNYISDENAKVINSIRIFRNKAVHNPDDVEAEEIILMKDKILHLYNFMDWN